MFCFGRFYASRFDFLPTEYRLNSKRHFRRTCVYCVFLIIVFRYLLLHIAICLLSFTLPLFCKVFSTGEHTQILEVPSKVFLAMIFLQHYILLRFFLKASKSFLFWDASRFVLSLPLCVPFFKTANVTSGQFVFIVLIASYNGMLPVVYIIAFLQTKCEHFTGKIHRLRSRCLANYLLTILSFYLPNLCKKKKKKNPFLFSFS